MTADRIALWLVTLLVPLTWFKPQPASQPPSCQVSVNGGVCSGSGID